MSRADKDYLTFIDGGSLVPYYYREAKYSRKPNVKIIESISLDMKTYCQTQSNTYYVSVVTESLVRYITAQDFLRVRDEFKKREAQSNVSKLQLVMDFC
ncbi:MAG: putative HTH transcriptional regulator [Sulfurimonas sp.]|jgi:predicted HTH transcriptional regulator